MVVEVNKLEQIKSLKKNRSIQELLNDAQSILRNPIAMFDMYYSLIAYTETVTDDPVWNELISTGTFSMETQKFFADAYFTLNVSSADRIVLLKTELLNYDRVLAFAFNRNHIKVANLVMVACTTAFTADDLVAFGAFAEKITARIRDDEHYTEYGKAYHSDLIGKILDGQIKDTRIYAPHIQILYDGFESNYLYLAAVRAGPGGAQQNSLVQLRDLLLERYKSFKFAIYSDYVIMIICSKQDSFNIKQSLGKYDEFFEQNDLFVGVSNSFENLYELRKPYDEAVSALKCRKEDGGDKRVTLFDNCIG